MEYGTGPSILGAETGNETWSLEPTTSVFRTLQNYTELCRTLLTFVANRSNVAGFCGVLEESEIQELEYNDNTERSV